MPCMCARSDCSAPRTLTSFDGRDRKVASFLTFDLDFGQILALGVADSPSVVIFRLSDETSMSVNWKLEAVITGRRAELEQGALILVEDGRYCMRLLPILGRSS